MITLRSIVFYLFFSLITLFFSILLMLLGWAIGFNYSSRLANAWGLVSLKLMKWICGLDYRVQGTEHLPEDTAVIILSNHQSAWETIAYRWLLPARQTWVLKKELISIPFFGWALRSQQPIAIDRSSGRVAARQIIEEGRDKLKLGRTVIIFPEGTRVAPGQSKKYGIGGAMLAHKSGYPVLPVAHNAGVFWRRRGLKKYPGTVQVVFGPLIETEGKSTSAINTAVESWITATVESLPKAVSTH